MHQVPRKGRYSVRKFIEKYGRSGNMTKWREQLNGDCPKRDASPSKNTPAAFLRARHRLADSGLRLDPCAGCRFGPGADRQANARRGPETRRRKNMTRRVRPPGAHTGRM